MTTTVTANGNAAGKVFVIRGFRLLALCAGQFVEIDGGIRDVATGDVFELGQRAFHEEKEAREVAKAIVQQFRL